MGEAGHQAFSGYLFEDDIVVLVEERGKLCSIAGWLRWSPRVSSSSPTIPTLDTNL